METIPLLALPAAHAGQSVCGVAGGQVWGEPVLQQLWPEGHHTGCAITQGLLHTWLHCNSAQCVADTAVGSLRLCQFSEPNKKLTVKTFTS